MQSKLATITERFTHGLGRMMKINHGLCHTIVSKVLSDVTHQRLAENRKRRLSAVGRQRPEALTVTRRENHCFHARSILSALMRPNTFG
jgi:hypothetical protein